MDETYEVFLVRRNDFREDGRESTHYYLELDEQQYRMLGGS